MAYFKVLPNRTRTPAQATSRAYLLTDNWDDWFKYSTLYSLIIFDEDGERHAIGGMKIGQFAMAAGQRRPNIPDDFDALDERFFSLGQDDSYYDDLNRTWKQRSGTASCGGCGTSRSTTTFLERAGK